MSLTSIQNTSSIGSNALTSGAVTSVAPSTATKTETTSAPASVASASSVSTAVHLASEASIVSILGGNQASTTTYTAAGLLNTFNNAGQASTNSSTSAATDSSTSTSSLSLTQNTTQDNSQSAEDKTIVGNINNGTTSQINPNTALYSAISTFSGTSNQSDLSSQWAAALKNNPSATTTLDQDNLNQQIVSTISINV